ncbi:hypothetical protein FRC15_007722 [Serendipita sp. 397]|nr:hypothetical protein FRC15_007722 [Serendipita sp. 397]
MGPPPDTPIPATTPEILLHYTYVDKIVQGLLFSAFALLVWDHALTFHREVEYVWKGRWTVIKILFLFTRYATLVVVGGNAWSQWQALYIRGTEFADLTFFVLQFSLAPFGV